MFAHKGEMKGFLELEEKCGPLLAWWWFPSPFTRNGNGSALCSVTLTSRQWPWGSLFSASWDDHEKVYFAIVSFFSFLAFPIKLDLHIVTSVFTCCAHQMLASVTHGMPVLSLRAISVSNASTQVKVSELSVGSWHLPHVLPASVTKLGAQGGKCESRHLWEWFSRTTKITNSLQQNCKLIAILET